MLIVDILKQCSLLEKLWFKVVHDMECEWCPSQHPNPTMSNLEGR